VIAGAITSKLTKAKLPTHIELRSGEGGISKDSVVLLEQLRTLDKRRLKARIGKVSDEQMEKINRALLISLGFFS
jgi:mRNA interferase MazF